MGLNNFMGIPGQAPPVLGCDLPGERAEEMGHLRALERIGQGEDTEQKMEKSPGLE